MSAESIARCARCGEATVEGRREDMPVCPTCEVTVLRDLLADRERELAVLRGAADRFVFMATDQGPHRCAICNALAVCYGTRRGTCEIIDACEAHRGEIHRPTDCDHAEAWRALCALLGRTP